MWSRSPQPHLSTGLHSEARTALGQSPRWAAQKHGAPLAETLTRSRSQGPAPSAPKGPQPELTGREAPTGTPPVLPSGPKVPLLSLNPLCSPHLTQDKARRPGLQGASPGLLPPLRSARGHRAAPREDHGLWSQTAWVQLFSSAPSWLVSHLPQQQIRKPGDPPSCCQNMCTLGSTWDGAWHQGGPLGVAASVTQPCPPAPCSNPMASEPFPEHLEQIPASGPLHWLLSLWDTVT